jgi:hypothetical protein
MLNTIGRHYAGHRNCLAVEVEQRRSATDADAEPATKPADAD